jgi:archaellum component FlaG (FlaF/FlaG flagellin family)
MKGSIKANLIVFLIIAVIAFCISSAFATLTIHEDNESYKLKSLEDDSFEPTEIDYVPTYIPKNDTNTTDDTTKNITEYVENTTTEIIENYTDNYTVWDDEED